MHARQKAQVLHLRTLDGIGYTNKICHSGASYDLLYDDYLIEINKLISHKNLLRLLGKKCFSGQRCQIS